MVGHGLQDGIYTSDYYLSLNVSTNDTSAATVVPTSYFLKTLGTLKDMNAWVMSFNGRDTDTLDDDVMPTAKVRVIDGTDTSAWKKAYVVYDCSTNKPIKGNAVTIGVKNYYVSLTDSDYNNVSSAKGDSTDSIKSYNVYAQTDTTVSYNTKDALDSSKVSEILGETEKTHKLKLVEVPVKKDTNDTYVYKDVSLYYGVYGIPDISVIDEGKETEEDKSSVKLFSVTGGLKANSYAEITDLGTIYTTNINNPLTPCTSTYTVKLSDTKVTDSTSLTDSSKDTYTFFYAGNDYAISKKNNKVSVVYKKEEDDTPKYFGVNFLSYNYITEHVNEAVTDVYCAQYFNGYKNNTESLNAPITLVDASIYSDSQEVPVTEDNLNTFIVTNEVEAA